MGKWKRRKKYSVLPKVEEELSFASAFRLTKLLKREMVVTAVSVLFVSTLILGSSYAVLTNIDKAEDYNVVKTGTLQIAYDDTSEGLGNIIRLNGAYPESDEEGQKREPYRFKITNTGSIPAEYNVKILDDSSMIEEDGCGDRLLDKSRLKYSIDGGEPVILSTMGEEYIVATNTLGAGESVVIEVRMWIDIESGNEVLGKHYHGKIVVEGVQSEMEYAVATLMKKVNNTSITYDSATEDAKKEMFTFTHTAGSQQEGWSEEELTDYRYVGTAPNNYVTFNDEVWRIIGIFTVEDENGSKEQRLKIIRDQSIGDFAIDNRGERGENAWNTSELQKVLNSGAYYNRTSGVCPNGGNGSTTPCDFSSIGLKEIARGMIANTKWYLGASNSYQILTENFYFFERSNSVYNGREKSYLGNIGLIYPSDYGYAAGTANCLNTKIHLYSNNNCKNMDWLYNGKGQRFITYNSNFSYVYFYTSDTGTVGHADAVYSGAGIRPTAYLKSNVVIISGDGSSSDPYQLDI